MAADTGSKERTLPHYPLLMGSAMWLVPSAYDPGVAIDTPTTALYPAPCCTLAAEP